MNIEEYQFKIQRTRATSDDELLNYCLGLAGETGEVIDIIKKHKFHGHELDFDKVEEELGDVLWYIGNLCNVMGLDLTEVCEKNISKLEARYKNGFNKEDSINRRV